MHCASIELDYDSWGHKSNGRKKTSIPTEINTITIEVGKE